MTEDQLNDIWDGIISGEIVEGWAGHKYGDQDVLTQLRPHRVWSRRLGGDPWDELVLMGKAHS
jgi:hypothetical protein